MTQADQQSEAKPLSTRESKWIIVALGLVLPLLLGPVVRFFAWIHFGSIGWIFGAGTQSALMWRAAAALRPDNPNSFYRLGGRMDPLVTSLVISIPFLGDAAIFLVYLFGFYKW